MEAKDCDADYWSERQWMGAVGEWFDGDPTALAGMILKLREIPDDVRQFLADLASGKVSRGKGGRPEERSGRVERSIVAAVFGEWDRRKSLSLPSPKDEAIASVAGLRGEPEGAIRGIVNRAHARGITFERWKAWGRPGWKITKPG